MTRTLLVLAAASAALAAHAETPAFPDAAASDPAALEWMQGSPPPADKVVRHADLSMYRFPQIRWSFANFRQLAPSTNLWRGDGRPAELPRALRGDIDGVSFQPLGGDRTMTWQESLAANYTDAILVLHRGRIVYERYFGVMTPHTQHMTMSVTKSFFGTLGAMLVEEGRLDPDALVSQYIPELRESAFGDATVRQVLDMTTGVRYSENYSDPDAEIWAHVRAGSVFPRPQGYDGPQSFYDFLQTLHKEGEHGQAFAYKTVNTDVLGWLIRRAAGRPVGDLLSERIWQKLGAEEDGYILVDTVGNEFAGGGLNVTLRDLARFGEAMRLDGRFNGQQIVPEGCRGRHPTRRRSRAFRPGRLHDATWLELPQPVVGESQRARRLLGPWHPRPDDLHRPKGGDGHCPFRVVSAGREREHRSDVTARLSRAREAPDALRPPPLAR